jgi:hypothetical protein
VMCEGFHKKLPDWLVALREKGVEVHL